MSNSKNIARRVEVEGAARFIAEATGMPVSTRAVYAWARGHKIPHMRLCGRVMFDLDELEVWIAAAHVVPAVYAGSTSGVMT